MFIAGAALTIIVSITVAGTQATSIALSEQADFVVVDYGDNGNVTLGELLQVVADRLRFEPRFVDERLAAVTLPFRGVRTLPRDSVHSYFAAVVGSLGLHISLSDDRPGSLEFFICNTPCALATCVPSGGPVEISMRGAIVVKDHLRQFRQDDDVQVISAVLVTHVQASHVQSAIREISPFRETDSVQFRVVTHSNHLIVQGSAPDVASAMDWADQFDAEHAYRGFEFDWIRGRRSSRMSCAPSEG